MKESVFQREVVNSFKEYGGWAYKIPDMPIGKQHKGKSAHFRFNVVKPFDILAMYNLRSIAIECKQMKLFGSFKLSHIRDSQIKALTEIEESGAGLSYIFLNIRIAKPYENRLIIMPWWVVQLALDDGNISREAIESCPFVHGKMGLFDISGWLKHKFGVR